jgi:hypothetical protein
MNKVNIQGSHGEVEGIACSFAVGRRRAGGRMWVSSVSGLLVLALEREFFSPTAPELSWVQEQGISQEAPVSVCLCQPLFLNPALPYPLFARPNRQPSRVPSLPSKPGGQMNSSQTNLISKTGLKVFSQRP